MNLHSPAAEATPRQVSATAVKAMLEDGAELALIDVREELIFSQNHLLWARSVPLSRLELGFAQLVPRLTTRIVLCDDADGLAEHAANILAIAGYAENAPVAPNDTAEGRAHNRRVDIVILNPFGASSEPK